MFLSFKKDTLIWEYFIQIILFPKDLNLDNIEVEMWLTCKWVSDLSLSLSWNPLSFFLYSSLYALYLVLRYNWKQNILSWYSGFRIREKFTALHVETICHGRRGVTCRWSGSHRGLHALPSTPVVNCLPTAWLIARVRTINRMLDQGLKYHFPFTPFFLKLDLEFYEKKVCGCSMRTSCIHF
jgi:hypothetical protein